MSIDEVLQALHMHYGGVDEERVCRAFSCARLWHQGQERESGDPYVTHPEAVALVLAQMGMDEETVIAGFLHDTLEDTGATYQDIEEAFGVTVANLVEGVTKLSRVHGHSEREKRMQEGANFRKFLLAVAKDVRILLIKLADRLHNMRTLSHVRPESRRQRIAHETLALYAPLAERLGMQKLRDELEDLAFETLYPEERRRIRESLAQMSLGEEVIQEIHEQIACCLKEYNIPAQIVGRQKRSYAIWCKMRAAHTTSDSQLSDILGFRIILPSASPIECYAVLGILHTKWVCVPHRLKDYISVPKGNGYQSLHTTLIGPRQKRVEVQIRTQSMHEIAENGIASHWKYKTHYLSSQEQDALLWFKNLADILQNTTSSENFIEYTKHQIRARYILCFTPDGQLVTLPERASALDFAYELGTDVGDTCVACRIYGQSKPLSISLKDGDEVEIVTEKLQKPAPQWEKWVVTGKARFAIQKSLQAQRKARAIKRGDMTLRQVLYKYTHTSGPLKRKLKNSVVRALQKDSYETLCYEIGTGNLDIARVVAHLEQTETSHVSQTPLTCADVWTEIPKWVNPLQALNNQGPFVLSPKTFPLLGEPIVGIVQENKTILVHPQTQTLVPRDNARITPLVWDEEIPQDALMPARLQISFHHHRDTLSKIVSLIYAYGSKILHLEPSVHDPTESDMARVDLNIGVRDIFHLQNMLTAMRELDSIESIERPYRHS